MLFRNSDWSRDFLDGVAHFGQFPPNMTTEQVPPCCLLCTHSTPSRGHDLSTEPIACSQAQPELACSPFHSHRRQRAQQAFAQTLVVVHH